MPFHVAMLPVDTFEGRSDAFLRDLDVEPSPEKELWLEIDSSRFSRRLARELNGAREGREASFALVTLLEPPAPEEGIPWEEWDDDRRRRYFVDMARKLDADLILACNLDYSRRVGTEKNVQFLLNIPLFLLGGPVTYFVRDRSYYVDTQLVGSLYDLGPVRADDDLVGFRFDDSLLVKTVVTPFQETTMNFKERSGDYKQVGSVAASFLVPAGFLASENQEVRSTLVDHVSEGLTRGFIKTLALRELEIVKAERRGGFYVEDWEAVPDGEELLLSGSVLYDPELEGPAEGLDYFVPLAKSVMVTEPPDLSDPGEAQVTEAGPFRRDAPGTGPQVASFTWRNRTTPPTFDRYEEVELDGRRLRRYLFETRVPYVPGETYAAGLELYTGGSAPRKRSFTFHVDPALTGDLGVSRMPPAEPTALAEPPAGDKSSPGS